MFLGLPPWKEGSLTLIQNGGGSSYDSVRGDYGYVGLWSIQPNINHSYNLTDPAP